MPSVLRWLARGTRPAWTADEAATALPITSTTVPRRANNDLLWWVCIFQTLQGPGRIAVAFMIQ